ncbi:glycosylphosphatidylinositol anchor biosynthesis [Sporothrix bragantina]|uniref:Mannosyltransferase n=1 Tax=Sporothrix bragantina TaxID=671064 RepID=A0ABP0BUW7_9PEZI
MAPPTSPGNSGDPARPAAKPTPIIPSKEQLEANYRIAAAATAGTLHQEVADAQDMDIMWALLALRWICSFAVRTFFQPDEYFQALEPAWQLARGPASGAWLTWEWKYHLRTSLHPVLFAGVYAAIERVLDVMYLVGPLRAYILVAAPGLVQASFTGLMDYYTWRLASTIYGRGHNAAWAAFWLAVVSPWQFYCVARTFSNGLEATLTIAALSYWPWQLLASINNKSSSSWSALFANGGTRRLRLCLVLAATAVVLRPTNILIWLALLTVTITRLTLDGPSSSFLGASVVARLFVEALGCGSLVLGVSAVSDRLFYGEWTFPAYIFFHINLTLDVAVFYGSHPWHYYLSQGLPLLTTTALPFALYGLYSSLVASVPATKTTADTNTDTEVKTKVVVKAADGAVVDPVRRANARKALSFTVVATVSALSLIAHKEVRFLYPLLPILLVLAAPHVAAFYSKVVTKTDKPAVHRGAAESLQTTKLRHKKVLAAVVAVNALLAGYLSFFHQPAPISVIAFLRKEYERIHHDWLEMPASELPSYDVYPDSFFTASQTTTKSDGDGDELFALFLTPCHSTPWRSHLVYPGLRARALTCEPPLMTTPRSAQRAAYRDEADRFYDDQAHFMSTELWPALSNKKTEKRGGEVPRYIVGFEGIEEMLNEYFASTDPARGGSGQGVQTPLRRAWVGWNGLFNEDWRRTGSLIVWDTGVFSNASHPDAERTYDEMFAPRKLV